MRSMLLLTALLAAHARAGGAKSAATPPCAPYRGAGTRLDVLIGFSAVVLVLLCPLALAALVFRRIIMGPRPAPPAMVRTLSLLEKGKRRNYVASASKEACLLAEYRLGPLQ